MFWPKYFFDTLQFYLKTCYSCVSIKIKVVTLVVHVKPSMIYLYMNIRLRWFAEHGDNTLCLCVAIFLEGSIPKNQLLTCQYCLKIVSKHLMCFKQQCNLLRV